MTDLPTAEDALAAIVAEVGATPIQVLAAAEIHRLDRVVRDLHRRGDGGLVVLVVQDRSVVPLLSHRLARHERDGKLQEVVGVDVVEGHLLVGRLDRAVPRSPVRRQVPMAAGHDASAAPVEGVELAEIDLRRASRLCRRDGPGVRDCDGDEARLLRLGVLVDSRGTLGVSVAGLAVYGRRPDLWLPMRLELMADDRSDIVEGSVRTILDGVSAWSAWPRSAPSALARAAIADALLWRDWEATAPIVLRLMGPRLRLEFPGLATSSGQTLAGLMQREGIVHDAQHVMGRVDRWLTARGVGGVSRLRRDGAAAFVWDLPGDPPGRPVSGVAPTRPHRLDAAPEPARQHPQVDDAAPIAAAVAPQEAALEEPSKEDASSAPPSAALEQVQAVVEALRRGPASSRELMDALGISRWSLRAALAVLKADGRVRAQAASPSSPFQRWELVAP